ncbi:uncharacterized protein LOC5514940 [Nematostella vectensis]|uniref:uncharacterized protein LOC5514940 n=1 Tax=Nematostella vectensis TaxID=45351 RepID=UPI002076F9D6|nr:uncharacterized protein LOC5514940 [Nematostella vectensis]
MEQRLCSGFTRLCLLLFYGMSVGLSQQMETNPEVLVGRSIGALTKGIAYYQGLESKGRVRSEELLGLRIASDSLQWVIDDCIKSPEIYVPIYLLEQMKMLCAKLNVLVPRIVNIDKPRNLTAGFSNFLENSVELFQSFRGINVDKEDRKEIRPIQSSSVPSLTLVQSCIGDLSSKNQTCNLPPYCWAALQPGAFPGSMVTHQAMLLLKVMVSGCSKNVNGKWKSITVQELADGICFSLYPRVSSFHQSGFLPDEETMMFLDSFFACSLLGFEDFLHVAHMRIAAILESQLSSGCFGFMRSSEGQDTEECIPRMTSAAIGTLALYVRWLLHSKGYASVYGNLPFKVPPWASYIKLLLLVAVSIIILVFSRRIRRSIRSLLGWIIWFRSPQ